MTELVLASMVFGLSEIESMTGAVLVIVIDAVSVALPPDRSVAVTVQLMVSPSTPIVASSCSGLDVPSEPLLLNHS